MTGHTGQGARLYAAANVAIDGAVAAEEVALALHNPDPPINSAVERILALRRYDVPLAELRLTIADVLLAYRHNDASGSCHLELAGTLEQMVLAERAAAATPTLADAVTVKGLVRALRDPLDVYVMVERGKPVDAADLVEARRTVCAIVETTPRQKLLSIEHDLGGRRFRALLRAIGELVT